MGKVNSKHRKVLYEHCGGVCPECGRKMSLTNPKAVNAYMTVDHIVPLSLGGTNNIGNLRPLCRRCNRNRGNNINNVTYKVTEDFHYVGRIN